MSLFGGGGGFGSNAATTERRTGTLFGNTTAPQGGLFSQPQQQNPNPQPTSSLFGSSTAAPQQNAGSLFGGNQGSTLFGAPQQQQPSQQPPQANSIFGGLLQPAPSLPPLQAQKLQQSQNGLPPLRSTLNNSQFASTLSSSTRDKAVQDQFEILAQKWDPNTPNSPFKFYFYNEVKSDEVPFYGPQPHEDPAKWEEALSKKPSPNSIPVLYRGFEELAARINYQNLAVVGLQTRLHEINNSLSNTKSDHELKSAGRIAEAKRRHIVQTQRTLALATKVQILRNRGYVMDHAEEDLKKKLVGLEKQTFDPVLAGRQEEIWARMSGVRERARILQEETEKLGKVIENQIKGDLLSDDDQKQVDKILRDYDRQLEHLKRWVDETKIEYEEWEKEQSPAQGR